MIYHDWKEYQLAKIHVHEAIFKAKQIQDYTQVKAATELLIKI